MAFALGALAVLPFVLGIYYAYSHGPFFASRALTWLLAYLGVIVGFVGGIQWGRMLARNAAPPQDMVLAIVPPLVAWAGLLMNSPWSLFLLLGALILGWLVDEHGYRSGWQGWLFLQLRRVLTAAVILCLIIISWRVLRGGGI
ncbi:DUF3429 domain-containing protein [Salinisphaera sp. Q1T1-3]|nr:DUF3429 domain-containing protein [Salinisphaera sp. Q1T1-3]